MGQQETPAPQQTALSVRYQISGKPQLSPFPCILGRDTLPMKRLGRIFNPSQDTAAENEIGENHATI
jgi:hypothetical protein